MLPIFSNKIDQTPNSSVYMVSGISCMCVKNVYCRQPFLLFNFVTSFYPDPDYFNYYGYY